MAASQGVRKLWHIQMLAVLILLQLPLSTFGLRITPSRTGPFRVVVRELSNCSKEINTDTDYFWDLHVSPQRAGQQQYIWGRTVTPKAITDSQQLLVTLDRKMNDIWKRNVFVMRFNAACSTAHRLSPSVMKILYGDNLKCPIPKGEFAVHNQTFNFDFPEFPVFPYGRWRTFITKVQSGKETGCMQVECDVVPKKFAFRK